MTATTDYELAAQEGFADEGTLVVDQHFAIVPEWIIDADISDCAYRLYSVLLRYGQSSGQRMPGRALLAARMKKKSKDTVDRALKELVDIGAVAVERRRRGPVNLTNRYHLVSSPPGRRSAPARGHRPCTGGGRNSAATPTDAGTPTAAVTPVPAPDGGRKFAATPGRRDAATPGSTDAATVAAKVRPDPGVLTQEKPPPPSSGASPAAHDVVRRAEGGGGIDNSSLLDACGIEDLDALSRELQLQRRQLGQPAARWTAARLLEVLHEAVTVRGWPASAAVLALRAIAADRATKSPMRLPCPGPWWDLAERAASHAEHDPAAIAELQRLEARLAEADGRRVALQRQARAELEAEAQTLSRLTVARRACELLDRDRSGAVTAVGIERSRPAAPHVARSEAVGGVG
jgi:hypothetical protein